MIAMPPVSTAVILAAGLGTRMLPATKAVPKELLTVVDKPLLQYSVEEAVASGIDRIIMVIAEGKEAIAEHFGTGSRIEIMARERNDEELLAKVRFPSDLAEFHYVHQSEPLGIAHAVACAREFVEGQPFALIFPDDLILSKRPVTQQLLDAHAATAGSVIGVQHVPDAEIPQYGIIDPVSEDNPTSVRGLVEKPSIADAPSSLGVVGRYVLSETVFKHIDRIPPGKNGEYQLTDALASQVAAGEPVSALAYEGRRFDTGRPLGFVSATIAVALDREDLRAPLLAQLAKLTETGTNT